MAYENRSVIFNPAEGLIVYCTNCNPDGTGVLTIYQNGKWRILTTDCPTPVLTAGTNDSVMNGIHWHWNYSPIANGYKWNTTNDYNTAIDLGSATGYPETGLICFTTYTRYIWAYNDCGVSPALELVGTTAQIPFSPAPLVTSGIRMMIFLLPPI
ncbi:MAG: hypothetical protein NTU44_04470 [Bacteroidetes bacterium]|nr:hypothetical protein [Bacteroidota bacterium]